MQTPNCQYGFTLSAHRVLPASSPGVVDFVNPLPVEVGFNPDTAVFSLSKCNAYGDFSDLDGECNDGTVPRIIEGRIALVVTLNNDVSTFDWVFFDTRIEGCGFDSVYLSGQVS